MYAEAVPLISHPAQSQYSPTRSPLRSSPMRNRSPVRQKAAPLWASTSPNRSDHAQLSPCQSPRHSPRPRQQEKNSSYTQTEQQDSRQYGASPQRSQLDSQRQYADLKTRLSALSSDYSHLEDELSSKTLAIQELVQTAANADRLIRTLQSDAARTLELHQREINAYKELMEELRRHNNILARKLDLEELHTQAKVAELEEKYSKLATSYKALQSNLELEQNSKALLIDQIEYLTKERDFLLDNAAESASVSGESMVQYSYLDQHPDSSGTDSDGSIHGTHLLSAFVDECPSPLHPAIPDSQVHHMGASSPLKHVYDSENSMEIAQTFQFPPTEIPAAPSPLLSDPKQKRQSLPAKFRPSSPRQDTEFVLSPLKLTSNANLDFLPGTLPTPQLSATTQKRYSSSKPHHNRYNSHDLFPIKVEFEQSEPQMRSASSPEKEVLNRLASVEEDAVGQDRDEAFMKLNGFDDHSSKRNSYLTSSSKRSSLITDFNILNSDFTKQEIMTLKFELQSLKLHNEKLLSYIGFELQKQKKNIKKLSSKQNLQALNIEYSDAKLIEKLRNMLIHKKRILRSVSINPILSTKYNQTRNSSMMIPGTGIGLYPSPGSMPDEEEDFVFNSDFIDSLNASDCDDYGFLSHEGRYNLRVLSRKNQAYLNEQEKIRVPKKFRSQNFRPSMDMGDYEQAFADIDEVLIDGIEEEEEGDTDWDTASNKSSTSSEIDYTKLNTFNQMRYLIMGKDHFRKTRRANETLVDEHLKYKFLTIVLGIVIVGFRLTAHSPQTLTHN